MLENKDGPIILIDDMPKVDSFILMISPLCFGICMSFWGGWYLLERILNGIEITFSDISFFVLVLIIGVFFIIFGWFVITDVCAYYDFSSEGLGVKYLLEKRKIIPWDAFQQVCVCYTSYSTRGERHAHSVLCFVRHGEKYNAYGRWKADNFFHSRSVISIEYTEELYAEVQKYCPYETPDLRKTRRYRL